MTIGIRDRFFAATLGLLMLAFVPPVWAEAGAVVSVWGRAAAQRGGQNLQLVENSAVESGDVLTTGGNGYLYVRMTNGEEIYLRPNAEFAIEDYQAPRSEAAPETGRSYYRLLKGAFRAVTHSLGRRDMDSYRVASVAAMMGIRGSIILGAIDAESGDLYFGVEEGGGVLSNANGTLNLDAGEYAVVSGPQFAPQPLSSQPGILAGEWTPPIGGGGGLAGGSAATSGATAAGIGAAVSAAAITGMAITVFGDDDDGGGTTSTTDTRN